MHESSPDHGALLTIDLGAICDNWRLLNARAAPGEAAAVVKADAYGCGIEAVVPALVKAGCHTFFVAHLSEAERLRKVATGVTLYVLNGLPPGEASAFTALNARPVLGSLEEVEEWRGHCARMPGFRPAALHVDTGMNRLGLRPAEALALDRGGLNLTLLMTHFVSSEDPADPVNARQYGLFAEVRRAMPEIPASISNSAGFFHEEREFYEQFRAGYALYGGNPTPGKPNPMKPVVRLDATVVQVRRVPKGETVGYNSQWTAKRETRVAVVSLGYADGYPRRASATDTNRGGAGRIGGHILPFAGRVSMDLIALDITDLPPGLVTRGSQISLIDEVLDVDAVGAAAGTIGYEVLTSLGRRYRRLHVGG